MSDRGSKRMKDITAALKDADKLILATDPDREGEAISWHANRIIETEPQGQYHSGRTGSL